MALVTDTWNQITLLPYTDPAWTGLSPIPAIPGTLGSAILNGDPIIVYVIAGGDPALVAFVGGKASIPAAVIDTESLQTGVTVTNSLGQVTAIVKDGTSTLWFTPLGGSLYSYDATATGDINTITS